ncbi:hypothetical protein GCM10011576_20790 [Micromonospora parathelypteridis]|nr:hypothetical protein GCM10011576_20790 [Micromonospora parathelypteridis]
MTGARRLRAEHQADAEQRGEAGDGHRQLATHLDRGYDLLLRLVDLILGSASRLAGTTGTTRPTPFATIAVGGCRTGTRGGRVAAGRCGGRTRVGPSGPRFAARLGRGGGKHDPIVPDRPPGAVVTGFSNVKIYATIRGKLDKREMA